MSGAKKIVIEDFTNDINTVGFDQKEFTYNYEYFDIKITITRPWSKRADGDTLYNVNIRDIIRNTYDTTFYRCLSYDELVSLLKDIITDINKRIDSVDKTNKEHENPYYPKLFDLAYWGNIQLKDDNCRIR